MISTKPERVLTATDRCDKCNAPAKVVVTFLNGELMFCGHDARYIRKSLMEKSATIFDPDNELDLIN
jgi:hypothetical protein